MVIAAFDPGRNVGFALVDSDGRLLRRAVLRRGDLAHLELPASCTVVIGAGTGRRELHAELAQRSLDVHEVDERGSSLVARELWKRAVPARGIARLLPAGLRAPTEPIDDFAAWAIALRYLGIDPAQTTSFSSGLRPH